MSCAHHCSGRHASVGLYGPAVYPAAARINRDTISMNAGSPVWFRKHRWPARRQVVDGYERERPLRTNTGCDGLPCAARHRHVPVTFFIAVAVAAVIAVALYQANHGGWTVGSRRVLAALADIQPVKRLTKIAGSMQRMLVSAESVFTARQPAERYPRSNCRNRSKGASNSATLPIATRVRRTMC